MSRSAAARHAQTPQLAIGVGLLGHDQGPGVGHPHGLAVEDAVRGRAAAGNEPVDRAVGIQHVHAAGGEVGHVEPAVGTDGHAVQDGVVTGHSAEVFDGAVGPQAPDMAGVGLVPHTMEPSASTATPLGKTGSGKSTRRLVLPSGAMAKI